MNLNIRSLFLIGLLLVLPLSACGPQVSVAEDDPRPAQLEPIEGTDLNRITLTEEAADRLGLEVAEVRTELVDGVEQLVVPYAALLYGPDGITWVYVNVEPLVFMRQAIVVDSIQGDDVFLSEGPEAGASVVTLGATELFGSESEFEEE